VSSLQLISRNFGRASCDVGWEFGNYKYEIINLIGNRPIKFGSFASNYQIIEICYEIPNQVGKQVRKLQTILTVNFKN
jgi:hypothetical protein